MFDLPFIHLFATETSKYVYDVNSNEIIKVNDIVFDYFHLLLSGIEPHECKRVLTTYYESDAIENSIAFIQEVQGAKLYFSKARPKEISLFCCKDSFIMRQLYQSINTGDHPAM